MAEVNLFLRQAIEYKNDVRRSIAALVGIAQGLLADKNLNDQEIGFLNDWLTSNDAIAALWPCDILQTRIEAVLHDGKIVEDERAHLIAKLQELIGGDEKTNSAAKHVTELAYDPAPMVEYSGNRFCITGEFAYGKRERCEEEISKRGGELANTVTKKLRYLIVGSLGSKEWKHGSWGTKIDKAVRYRTDGCAIAIVRESHWTNSLKSL